jgi:hypothetical protein
MTIKNLTFPDARKTANKRPAQALRRRSKKARIHTGGVWALQLGEASGRDLG